MAQMRTLPKAYEEGILAKDPDTDYTFHAFRRDVLLGNIPHVNVGTKRLVSLESIDGYLSGTNVPMTEVRTQPSVIRRIEAV